MAKVLITYIDDKTEEVDSWGRWSWFQSGPFLILRQHDPGGMRIGGDIILSARAVKSVEMP